MVQLQKRFADSEVRQLLKRYVVGEVKRKHIEKILGIGKRRFFLLVKGYKQDKDNFSVEYRRGKATRKIDDEVEDNILLELTREKKIIDSPDNLVKDFNYSYIRDLVIKNGNNVSVSTVISRAKKYGFYKKKKKAKDHDQGGY